MDKKYEWETEKEYEYRQITSNLSGNMAQGLDVIVKQSSVKIQNYIQAIKIFKKIIESLKSFEKETEKELKLYRFVNMFFLTGVENYLRACELLEVSKSLDGNTKINSVYKAQRLINEGNSWIEISKCRIAEAFEVGHKRIVK